MLIDTHLHLTDERLKAIPNVMEEAQKNGVTKLITIGTHLTDNSGVIKLIEQNSNIFGGIGIYPHEDLSKSIVDLEKELDAQINKSKKIVGVGECGIDLPNQNQTNAKHENSRSLTEQLELFEMQINLAIKYQLPIIIHNRNGDKEVLNLLNKYTKYGLTGVLHCFTSTWNHAKKLLDLGFYISFSGIITYPTGATIHETVKNIPIDRFVIETDAPYLAPQGFRGKINEPKYVRMTANKVAEIKGVSQEIIDEAAYKNSCTIFKLPA